MLSKTHWHFKPLIKSLLYFSSVGVGLTYFGVCLKDFSIGAFFLIPGAVCLLLAVAAAWFLTGKTSNDYYDVFSLKKQKSIRVIGLLFPWLFLGTCLAGYYGISTISQQMLTKKSYHLSWSKGFKLPWTQNKYPYGLTDNDFSNFAKTVTEHFACYDSSNYKEYTKTLINVDLAPKVVRRLKSEGYLPQSKLEFETIAKVLKDHSYDKVSTVISKPEYLGKTPKDNFLKYKVFVRLKDSTVTEKIVYELGIHTKTKKPIAAHMDISRASHYDRPQW